MNSQQIGMIIEWLDTRKPSDPNAIASFASLGQAEVELGFVKAIEMGRGDWIEAFVRDLGCSLDRFVERRAGDCPLSHAIDNGPPHSLAKLLALGADPNVLIHRDIGHRPLHVAVDLESTDHKILASDPPQKPYTELLVAAGADPLFRDFSGVTPLGLAIRRGVSPLKALLEEAASSRKSKLLGRLAMARRIAKLAPLSADRPSLEDSDINRGITVRLLVEIAIQHDFAEWIDDDLLRLSEWLAELGDLDGAAKAARKASADHPYRASQLMKVVVLLARGEANTTDWRELMAISLESSSRICYAWLRIEPLVAAASFLIQRGERDSGERLLEQARKILGGAETCWQRDEALAGLSHRYCELGMKLGAFGVTRLIQDARVRWQTRKNLLLRVPEQSDTR